MREEADHAWKCQLKEVNRLKLNQPLFVLASANPPAILPDLLELDSRLGGARWSVYDSVEQPSTHPQLTYSDRNDVRRRHDQSHPDQAQLTLQVKI